MKIIYKILLAVFFCVCFISVNAQTKIIAHRGFSGIAPENTLVAFKKAIEVGADYFELDVHKTLDDSVIIIHDYSLKRTSSDGKTDKIEDLTYKQIEAASVGYNEKFGDEFSDVKIPTLREALELAKGKIKVCVEIKVFGVEQAVLDIINQLGMHDDVIIFSFHYPVLAKIRQYDKEIPILYLIGKGDAQAVYYANAIDVNALGVGTETKITDDLLELVHTNNMELWQWTINEEKGMEELLTMKIDGMITNFPDKALKLAGR